MGDEFKPNYSLGTGGYQTPVWAGGEMPMSFSAENLAGLSGSGTGGFSWQNPYAWNSWGAGLDPSASFGTKLGGFMGGNAPLFMGGLQAISGGIQAYTGLKGVNLAQKALKQEKKAFNINLTNQTQSYNTQVGDRIAGRSYASEAERQAALAAAQLVDRSKYGKGG
jgi:hypothetical protein